MVVVIFVDVPGRYAILKYMLTDTENYPNVPESLSRGRGDVKGRAPQEWVTKFG